MQMSAYAAVLLVLVSTIGVAVYRRMNRHSLSRIRGPPSPSLLLGHNLLLSHEDDVGDLESEWIRQYGSAWRLKDCVGEDNLWLVDPKALHHIFHKAGHKYSRRIDARQISRQLTGDGILFANDHEHARIRKIMDPAFSTAQIRSFLPLFRRSAQ
ncbi:cytochrome P450, partial [Laetiporus sulphureus 93-53]